MKNTSIYVFLFLLVMTGSGYVYLEYFKSTRKSSQPSLEPTADSMENIWANDFHRLQTEAGHSYSFVLPEPWTTSISAHRPAGAEPLYTGYRIRIKHPKKDLLIEWFSPLKFHYYLGDIGVYLSPQRAPLSPLATLQSFFNHPIDSCREISPPVENWNGQQYQAGEYYTQMHTAWFEVKGQPHPTYYYVKVKKAPTPGVYGDLGSWTFSALRFQLPENELLNKNHLEAARTFYHSIKKESQKEPEQKS